MTPQNDPLTPQDPPVDHADDAVDHAEPSDDELGAMSAADRWAYACGCGVEVPLTGKSLLDGARMMMHERDHELER